MLRRLYRCSVRLHPSSFRRRFGDEMLSIFDQEQRRLAALGLMLDCVFSLLKQWTLRPHVDKGLPAAASRTPTVDHIPSFQSFDSFQPHTSAIIHGALLTVILFYMTAFGIRYSWIHVLNIHIPEIGENPSETLSGNSKNSSEHAEVDVIPTDAEASQSKSIASNSSRSSAVPVGSLGATIWLDQYVGKYISNQPPAKIWIQIERDPFRGDYLSLSLAASGHPSVALSPESPTRFVVAGAENSYVDFATDIRGNIFGLSLVEGAEVINARRQ